MKPEMKDAIKRMPVLGKALRRIYRRFFLHRNGPGVFPGSAAYWEQRYATGGNSGVGSYDRLAEFKAEVLNGFIATHPVQTVIEFGCGDGNQLRLATYPMYVGLDVSSTAIAQCRLLFASDANKVFHLMDNYHGERADLALSLDVIYHLVEDEVFTRYMQALFAASNRYVIIYASDSENNRGYEGTHVKHRKFTQWIQEQMPVWTLVAHVPNRYPYRGDNRTGSFAEFYIYEKS